mmetsp:Transcript_68392/g.216355  ORF Transcript_68392/g.216355 Transcript_68392/m.216355 type:complete len:208 (+) Transcript_68392:364-987(+)
MDPAKPGLDWSALEPGARPRRTGTMRRPPGALSPGLSPRSPRGRRHRGAGLCSARARGSRRRRRPPSRTTQEWRRSRRGGRWPRARGAPAQAASRRPPTPRRRTVAEWSASGVRACRTPRSPRLRWSRRGSPGELARAWRPSARTRRSRRARARARATGSPLRRSSGRPRASRGPCSSPAAGCGASCRRRKPSGGTCAGSCGSSWQG